MVTGHLKKRPEESGRFFWGGGFVIEAEGVFANALTNRG